jgi:two-component system, chemotaxis family, protein-glutamate methylesterase/glutaminase
VSDSRGTAAKEKVRVLIVDDSAVMRRVLREVIAEDTELEVIAEACDGREGVELARSLRPDVITMDIEMPWLNGFEATEAIMSSEPRPIVIISSIAIEGSDCVRRAAELGAVDAMAKPASGNAEDLHQSRAALIGKLKRAARMRVTRIVPTHESNRL